MCDVLRLCEWSGGIAFKDMSRSEEKIRQEMRLISKLQYYQTLEKETVRSSQRENKYDDGMYRLKKLIKYLKKLDIVDNPPRPRSTAQQRMHKAFTCASLKKIVGPDLPKYLEEAFTLCEMVELRSDVIVLFPRRHGKTEGTARFVAVYLLTQPGASISVFSTGIRTARKMLLKIVEILMKLHESVTESPAQFETHNKEEIGVYGFHGKVSKCFSYPSKVQIDVFSTGQGGSIICLGVRVCVCVCVFFFLYV